MWAHCLFILVFHTWLVRTRSFVICRKYTTSRRFQRERKYYDHVEGEAFLSRQLVLCDCLCYSEQCGLWPSMVSDWFENGGRDTKEWSKVWLFPFLALFLEYVRDSDVLQQETTCLLLLVGPFSKLSLGHCSSNGPSVGSVNSKSTQDLGSRKASITPVDFLIATPGGCCRDCFLTITCWNALCISTGNQSVLY